MHPSRIESCILKLDHHVAAEPEVVEEMIDPEVLTAHLQRIFAPDEANPTPSSMKQSRRCTSRDR